MSLKTTITDIMTRLREIEEVQFVHVFNNQFRFMEEQQSYSFPFPCVFVETINPQQFNQLGGGYQQADIDFRIHIGMDQYDSADGNMEQNLTIHDLRDLVFTKLALYKPTMCGELFKVNEEQDYEHTNIYHYIIDFRTCFIDKTASTLITPTLVDPITLELDVWFVHADFDIGDFDDSFAVDSLSPGLFIRDLITL
jgi:hypothetical protein